MLWGHLCFINTVTHHLFFYDLQREADKNNHMAVIPVVHYSEMSMTDQITWLNTFAYRVGQLGVIR